MKWERGLTLVELMMVAMVLSIGIVALLGAFISQMALNEHARNMAWAMNDANRVMERLRQQNTGSECLTPSAAAPTGFASWDVWLADTSASGGGGKNLLPNPSSNELIVVTPSGSDPLEITVAVCWRHRSRTLGECSWDGGTSTLEADEDVAVPDDDPNVIQSPAMLSTLMTCRSEA